MSTTPAGHGRQGGARPTLSLKARALQWLALREHSRLELRRKLLRRARLDAAAAAAAAATEAEIGNPGADPCADADPTPSAKGHSDARAPSLRRSEQALAAEVEAEVDLLLDWLEAERHLSAGRFVESRVHARAARHGNRRIAQELAQHGLRLDPATAEALRDSEFARARALWQRRFAHAAPTGDVRERARQMRFLSGRGFSAEVIRRVVAGDSGDED